MGLYTNMIHNIFSTLCRLCLGKANVSTPIFGEDGIRRGLQMKITTCLPVQVSKDDELPKMICVDCLNKVEQTYIFRKSTAIVEKQLHRLLLEATKQVAVDIVGSHHIKEEVSYLDNKQDQEYASDSQTVFIKEEWHNDETDEPPPLIVSSGTEAAWVVKSIQPQQTSVSHTQLLPNTVILSTKHGDLKQPLTIDSHSTQRESSGYPDNTITSYGNEREQSSEEKNKSSTDSCTEEPGSRQEKKQKNSGTTLKPCEFCGKRLPIGKQIVHKRMHTGERPFVCTICTETFISKLALKRHSIMHSEDRPYSCDMCPQKFKRYFTFNNHRKIHFGEKNHVCDICGYSCIQKASLVNHRRRHFNEYTSLCNICHKGFYTNSELRLHLIAHTSDRPHQCHVCGLTFHTQKGLSVHLKSHTPGHVAPSPEPFCCDLCGKCFFSKPNLIRHIKQHTVDNRRPCEVCGKHCSVDYMKLHIQTHTGETPEKCSTCGKSFKCKNDLSIHMRTHTGESPYKCNYCGKTFTQRSSLGVHKRSSTRCKALADHYTCHCGETFGTNELLRNHFITKQH